MGLSAQRPQISGWTRRKDAAAKLHGDCNCIACTTALSTENAAPSSCYAAGVVDGIERQRVFCVLLCSVLSFSPLPLPFPSPPPSPPLQPRQNAQPGKVPSPASESATISPSAPHQPNIVLQHERRMLSAQLVPCLPPIPSVLPLLLSALVQFLVQCLDTCRSDDTPIQWPHLTVSDYFCPGASGVGPRAWRRTRILSDHLKSSGWGQGRWAGSVSGLRIWNLFPRSATGQAQDWMGEPAGGCQILSDHLSRAGVRFACEEGGRAVSLAHGCLDPNFLCPARGKKKKKHGMQTEAHMDRNSNRC